MRQEFPHDYGYRAAIYGGINNDIVGRVTGENPLGICSFPQANI